MRNQKPLVLIGILLVGIVAHAEGPTVSASYPVPLAGVSSKGSWYFDGSVIFSGAKPVQVGDLQYGPDFLVNKSKTSNAVMKWTGCIPPSSVSMNFAGLMVPNPSFTGDINSANPASVWQITFATRWDFPSALFVFRDGGSGPIWTPVPSANLPMLASTGFCGDYRLIKRDGFVRAFVNGSLVFEGTSFSPASEITAYAQSYDRPLAFSGLRFVVKLDDDEDD